MVLGEDLGVQYAKNMAHFGCGVAMFQPVSACDMQPPCVGYIDGNNRWNFVANVEWLGANGELQGNSNKLEADEGGYQPLERKPVRMEQLGIEWRPRTSMGVRQWTVDANGQMPSIGIPVGADAHIRYKSNNSFGAVLIAQKPITLTTYNDETLFRSWLHANRARLSLLHGHQLRRHGLWLVTRTYTTPRASIIAWDSEDKEANMSMKAKANMMGELGGELEWTEKGSDKDWSHYFGNNTGETVVVFFDGVEVPGYKWWWENVKVKVAGPDASRQGSPNRGQSAERRSEAMPEQTCLMPNQNQPPEEHGLLTEDLWGSQTPLRRGSMRNERNERSLSRGRRTPSRRSESPVRDMSTPTRLSKYLAYEPENPAASPTAEARSTTANGESTATPPPTQRFSTASTAASSSTNKAREPDASDIEGSDPASLQKNAAQKKTSSPRISYLNGSLH
ncbi:hypothetical protein N7G274_007045 [Stereocaulon virgatum]|uniref:Uncharacterized protein n=1 Tax=Stereocaulon virgatum TaxID=373712 RepID=A0ABR4A6X0_9LECA